MVEVQRRLVDHLGIERLRAVVGGSLGGHMVLTWATRFPGRVAGAVALATSPRLTSQALAFDVVGRNAILRDPAYRRTANTTATARARRWGWRWRGCWATSPISRAKR